MQRGAWYAAGAYAIWGLLPLYWKALHALPALQIISHRLAWSGVLLCLVILITRQVRVFRAEALKPRVLAVYALAGLLLSVNWFTYVWAVNAGFVVETSLGYFINPLISVLLGVVFLGERLRPVQWLAIGLAASGVLYLSITYGAVPWIALVLALTFSVYGLLKKLAPLGSVNGLALETGVMFVPAVTVLALAESNGTGSLLGHGWLMLALLMGTGVATTVPLLLFASASKRIPLLWIGLLQYIAPTLQFLLGVLVYHEPLTAHRLVGFALVWAALAVFGAEAVANHRRASFPAVTD